MCSGGSFSAKTTAAIIKANSRPHPVRNPSAEGTAGADRDILGARAGELDRPSVDRIFGVPRVRGIVKRPTSGMTPF